MKLTDYLAVYGAALSTLVFLWNASRAKSKIKVRLTIAVVTMNGKTKSGLGISIQNPSASAVHITNVAFVYPWRKITFRHRLWHLIKFRKFPIKIGWCHSALSNYDVNDECPATIEPGKSHWIFVSDEVAENLLSDATERKLIVQVQDALWRNKYSHPFAYPIKRH